MVYVSRSHYSTYNDVLGFIVCGLVLICLALHSKIAMTQISFSFTTKSTSMYCMRHFKFIHLFVVFLCRLLKQVYADTYLCIQRINRNSLLERQYRDSFTI